MNPGVRIFLALAAALSLQAQETEVYEMPPVNYSKTKPHDAVTRLQAEIGEGKVNLAGPDRAVVESVLQALGVPVASQMLVFSKTSFQKDIIGPKHPRALFFSDDCYVGWVPGGLMEIAAIDPQLGPVFYSFDPRGLSKNNPPEFQRDNDCLRCHGGSFVRGIPAVFARSLFADKEGEPIFREGSQVVNDQTPFAERWGGWYVTGRHGEAVHRGNVLAREVEDKLVFNAAAGANITNLSPFFDTGDYLAAGSDIAALLVFEHQTAMQNALTRAAVNCRHMLDYQEGLRAVLKPEEPADQDGLSFDSVRSVFNHSADDVVDALLFRNEAPLPEQISGSPEFQKAFLKNVPHAADGSSLKDLLLSERLFKNRCSYLIYSASFQSLPPPLRYRVYARLANALNPEQPNPRFAYIGLSERRRIATILRETLPEFNTHKS
jgi:hypothetical protein